ncbi:MAG: biotin--[acetyl-CoA-carboxylase] ligase [Gammaproteobacteria bacterium]|nr:biotin--[acetyl-CoA-carboxylase] ligase [Gammaproteobacteria bacterium]
MSEDLSLEQIKQCLNRDCELVLFKKTDSTNEQALLKVKQGCILPLVCFTEEQTQGRGRRGKVWVSPPGSNIYMSLAWKFEMPVNSLGCLSLAMGVAVARVLKNLGLQQVGLKWPNDVLVDGKKIAGILIETSQITDKTTTAIIGIGLNFNLPKGSSDLIAQPWTDIVSSMGMEFQPGRNKIAALLLQECMSICDSLVQVRQDLMLEYQQYDICRQQAVNIYLDDGRLMQGVVAGFEENGEIRILVDDEERLFNSADISLRKASNVNN